MEKTMGRGAISDGFDTNKNKEPIREFHQNKTLIIYFSRSGNLEKQVKLAQRTIATDIYELVVTKPYPSDYTATVSRATQERNSRKWPVIRDRVPDLSQYDTILLGHPIWAMTVANPMRSFLEQYGDKLANKTVASFSTNAGYGSGDTQEVIAALTPTSTKIKDNYTVEDTEALKNNHAFISWLKNFDNEG